jgi:hypothetical protein
MTRLTLYSTWGCHLCEQAEALVQQAGLADRLQVQDIVDDEALFARFRVHIPVLAASDALGQEHLLYWPFDQNGLTDWLAALDLTTTD